jgi:hypothetical protein
MVDHHTVAAVAAFERPFDLAAFKDAICHRIPCTLDASLCGCDHTDIACNISEGEKADVDTFVTIVSCPSAAVIPRALRRVHIRILLYEAVLPDVADDRNSEFQSAIFCLQLRKSEKG